MAASVTTDKAMADVLRLQQAPLPKAYRDALVPAAQALKEALEAEEAVGDSFIGEEAEKNLSDLPGISCFDLPNYWKGWGSGLTVLFVGINVRRSVGRQREGCFIVTKVCCSIESKQQIHTNFNYIVLVENLYANSKQIAFDIFRLKMRLHAFRCRDLIRCEIDTWIILDSIVF